MSDDKEYEMENLRDRIAELEREIEVSERRGFEAARKLRGVFGGLKHPTWEDYERELIEQAIREKIGKARR